VPQLLLFRLGEDLCALEVVQVQELVESPRYHYIPRAPAAFLGAINFHGSIVAVLDLVASFGLAGAQRDRRIIVLSPAHGSLGLAVTAIQRIVTVPADEFLPAPEAGRLGGCIRAACSWEGETINLLDAARLSARLEIAELVTGGDHGA